MNTVICLKANQELEVKKLSGELNRLNQLKELSQIEKANQITDMKN